MSPYLTEKSIVFQKTNSDKKYSKFKSPKIFRIEQNSSNSIVRSNSLVSKENCKPELITQFFTKALQLQQSVAKLIQPLYKSKILDYRPTCYNNDLTIDLLLAQVSLIVPRLETRISLRKLYTQTHFSKISYYNKIIFFFHRQNQFDLCLVFYKCSWIALEG